MDHLSKRPITKLYEKICSYPVNRTIGVSSAICDDYLNLGLSKAKLLNINNGTKLTKYSEQSIHATKEKVRRVLGLNKESIIWSCVARIVPLKDQKIICDLARNLPMQTFLLIGPSGDNEYWDEIEKTKPNNVLMLGPREDISELLLSSDYFISASRHEGIPISVLEAGALKIPCLLSDIAGHKLIQSKSIKSVGIYFGAGNLEDLMEKAVTLSNDKTLSLALGVSLYQNVRENFSSKAMYNQYQEVYLN
jgi:glycosyltransferase involved in cell wall biosynthesis